VCWRAKATNKKCILSDADPSNIFATLEILPSRCSQKAEHIHPMPRNNNSKKALRSEEEFVVQALRTIGLSEATIRNFRDAGIVTPTAVAQLEAAHFGALGVEHVEHRQQLFFLVQTFKRNVPPPPLPTTSSTSSTQQQQQRRQSRRLLEKQERAGTIVDETETTTVPLTPTDSFVLDEALQSSVDQSLEEAVEENPVLYGGGDDNESYVSSSSSTTTASPAEDSPVKEMNKPHAKQQAVDDTLRYENVGGTTTTTTTEGSSTSIDKSWTADQEDVGDDQLEKEQPTKQYEVETDVIPADDDDDQLLDDALRTPSITKRKSHRRSLSWNGADSSDSSSSDGAVRDAISMQSDRSFNEDDETSVVSSKSLPPKRNHTSKIPTRQQSRIPQKHRRQTLVPKCSKVDTRKKPVVQKETRTGKQLSTVPADETLLMSPLQEVNLENPRRAATRKPSVFRSTSMGGMSSKKTNWKDLINDLRAKNDAIYDGRAFALPASSRIRVVVRKRPIVSRSSDDIDILHPLENCGHLIVYQPKSRVDLSKYVEETTFAFDQVFDQDRTNRDVYLRSIRETVQDFLNEQWVTIACYGQTGAGKTHTMMGIPGDPHNMGLYAMAALDIFHVCPNDLDVHVSMFEIYNGKFWDILDEGRKRIQCLEDEKGQMNFRGLSQYRVGTKDDFLNLIQGGIERRATGVTSRNADSSRSHAILQVHLVRRTNSKEVSRMTLIDLAGSERASDTHDSSTTTRAEGAEINTSLLALKEVIRALANDGGHVPFRLSPLTQVLKSAFLSSTTVFIACVAPDLKNCDPTMNTLRYADRIHQRNPKLRRQPSSESMSSHPSQVLDEILSSPKSKEHPLITSHKEMLAAQLELLEDELKLVDQTSDFDEYLIQLEQIHDGYAAVIEVLREQIRGGHRAAADEDSFEDLRD
jgi:kinesin family member 2/24